VPELPEVETVRRGLENHLLGRVIIHIELRRNDLRFPFPKDLQSEIEGRKVLAIDRRAKYLLIRLENDMEKVKAVFLADLHMVLSLAVETDLMIGLSST
jgi:formamidopyrimidine-DNA glycosylase